MADDDSQAREFVFDPKVFISKPYRQCPKCRRQASFGVLMIQPHDYRRRCRECWHSETFPLPQLRKKVLYLDQFAISNMMKALNPNAKPQKGEADDLWRELFRTVDRLCKLQLLVCPDSEFHWKESLVSPFLGPLKRMYELLSGGVTLHRRHAIELSQIYKHVQRWATGRESQAWEFDLRAVANGEVDGWWDRLMITTNWGSITDQWADEFRRSRDTVHEGMVEVFQRWRQERRDFWDWFREEARSYRAVLEVYTRYYQRLQDVSSGTVPPSLVGILPPPAVATVTTIHNALTKAGIAQAELWPRTVEYLTSDAVERLPFNRISAMLTAAIARKAAAGQRRPPTRGIVNDIGLISAYLPYLDSMFIDKECHGYLMEQPLRDELTYDCRVFSLNTTDELLSYLRDIEAAASSEHLATVKEVYGDDWATPYESLYAEPEA